MGILWCVQRVVDIIDEFTVFLNGILVAGHELLYFILLVHINLCTSCCPVYITSF